ncbi:hypothetical protein OIO90_004907 [Microbotryomycetes sp. JL221]|nr:hypothetical protein OIO90_004907 [Microbotryomycetes sp. JL221]
MTTLDTRLEQHAPTFHASITVEQPWLDQVVSAVLGTILFHRFVGNCQPQTVDCAGCTFSNADQIVKSLINPNSTRQAKLVVAFFPTPASTPPIKRLTTTESTPTSATTRTTTIGPTVTSAFNWFSNSAVKALSTVSNTSIDHQVNLSNPTPQQQQQQQQESSSSSSRVRTNWNEIKTKSWEIWIIQFQLLNHSNEDSEFSNKFVLLDRIKESLTFVQLNPKKGLRHDLNEFLIQSLRFVLNRTNHVPPIVTADLEPFGIQILINPEEPDPHEVSKQKNQPNSDLFNGLYHDLVLDSTTKSSKRMANRST